METLPVNIDDMNILILEAKGYITVIDTHEDPFDPIWKYAWTDKGNAMMGEFIQNLANLG